MQQLNAFNLFIDLKIVTPKYIQLVAKIPLIAAYFVNKPHDTKAFNLKSSLIKSSNWKLT